MNISKIIRKILLEDDEKKKALSLDPTDQYTFLNGVIQNCPAMVAFRDKPIRNLTKEEIVKFTKINETGASSAYYVAASIDNVYYAIFGIKDPEATLRLSTSALFMYRLTKGAEPERVVDGAGSTCEQLMSISDLGKVNLSEKNAAQLSAFTEYKGAAYVELEKPENIALYDQIAYKDLKYDDGRQVFDPIPAESGYIWLRKGLKQKVRNLPAQVQALLVKQGFTSDETMFDIDSDAAKYKFYLKDILNDWPGLTSQKDALRPTDFIYPKNEILNPDKSTCRTAIKKLHYCITSKVGTDCGIDLFKNKFTVIRCGDKLMLPGIFGVKDEYETVVKTGVPYGIADLLRYLKNNANQTKPQDQFESLEKKINLILNEQKRKFRF